MLALVFISCSTEEDDQDELANCTYEVYNLTGNCTPDCRYTITYGKSEDDLTTIEVDQKTYDYYMEVFADDEELDCWEGVK